MRGEGNNLNEDDLLDIDPFESSFTALDALVLKLKAENDAISLAYTYKKRAELYMRKERYGDAISDFEDATTYYKNALLSSPINVTPIAAAFINNLSDNPEEALREELANSLDRRGDATRLQNPGSWTAFCEASSYYSQAFAVRGQLENGNNCTIL